MSPIASRTSAQSVATSQNGLEASTTIVGKNPKLLTVSLFKRVILNKVITSYDLTIIVYIIG